MACNAKMCMGAANDFIHPSLDHPMIWVLTLLHMFAGIYIYSCNSIAIAKFGYQKACVAKVCTGAANDFIYPIVNDPIVWYPSVLHTHVGLSIF